MEGQADEALTLLPTDGDLNDAGYRELVGMRGMTQLLRDEPSAATEHLRIRLRPNLVDHRQGQSPVEVLTATGPDGIEPNKLVILVLLAEAERAKTERRRALEARARGTSTLDATALAAVRDAARAKPGAVTRGDGGWHQGGPRDGAAASTAEGNDDGSSEAAE